MFSSKGSNGICHTFMDLNGVIRVLNKIEDITIFLDSRNKLIKSINETNFLRL